MLRLSLLRVLTNSYWPRSRHLPHSLTHVVDASSTTAALGRQDSTTPGSLSYSTADMTRRKGQKHQLPNRPPSPTASQFDGLRSAQSPVATHPLPIRPPLPIGNGLATERTSSVVAPNPPANVSGPPIAGAAQADDNYTQQACYNNQWAEYYNQWAQHWQQLQQTGYSHYPYANQANLPYPYAIGAFNPQAAYPPAQAIYPPVQAAYPPAQATYALTQPTSASLPGQGINFQGVRPTTPSHQLCSPNLEKDEGLGRAPAPGAVSDAATKSNDGATATAPRKDRRKKGKDPKIMLPAPQPTPEYLAQASSSPTVLDPPDGKLVILDLNGTLLYRPNARNQPTRMIGRPFLRQFLSYLFENFSVMIWSSAKPENVKILVENGLGEDFQPKLAASWARDTLGLTPKQYDLNVQVYKDLSRVWGKEEIQSHISGFEDGKRFDQRNTILIDDSALKASAQPHNLLEVPEFKGTWDDMKQDVLGEVAGYLELLKMQEDVSRFIRQTPFKADGTWQYAWEVDRTEAGTDTRNAPLDDGDKDGALEPVVVE
ncbi:HAD-like protein [Trematosphaeria pertusa]|uniref:Mitochondrial import inner membrane translocase subunit TIM50 n=1 Tax=Trematosphaeria pertusa TaxID=390896 RepID=A0A6A6HZG0_9PLEO|nr:HAD-like protein [Trematosphaeria pertusa]KAF2243417.1 HAD-like protein [Trematosphaeria pertusa]